MKKIGFVGCGAISGIYLENLTNMFDNTEIVGVCDLIPERAEAVAEKYNVKRYANMHELFADPNVDIVLNLTRPYEHFDVTIAALNAGKHVYTEKPLGATFEEGQKIIQLAQEKGLQIGGAPDTFLGAGIQTCKKLIESGFIGDIVGASAHMACHGHESWHPDPAFYYQFGGGPMLDMGPYYTTALVQLIGRVKSVTGVTRASFPTRTITSKPHYGEVVKVEVPTHYTGILEFENGAVGTMLQTFDVFSAELPRIEIYGSKGTLSVPDPNTFGGPVKLYRPEEGSFKEIPLMFPYPTNSRGLGVSDMADALETGRPHRASAQQIFHVLQVMTAMRKSSDSRATVDIQ